MDQTKRGSLSNLAPVFRPVSVQLPSTRPAETKRNETLLNETEQREQSQRTMTRERKKKDILETRRAGVIGFSRRTPYVRIHIHMKIGLDNRGVQL